MTASQRQVFGSRGARRPAMGRSTNTQLRASTRLTRHATKSPAQVIREKSRRPLIWDRPPTGRREAYDSVTGGWGGLRGGWPAPPNHSASRASVGVQRVRSCGPPKTADFGARDGCAGAGPTFRWLSQSVAGRVYALSPIRPAPRQLSDRGFRMIRKLLRVAAVATCCILRLRSVALEWRSTAHDQASSDGTISGAEC
jgi:hypothetical protein